MQQQSRQPTEGLDQRQAELMGRQFNMAFTSTTGYGPGHPIAQRSYDTIVENLREGLTSVPSLTLMLDRDSLFIEQHMVDRKFNAKRLIQVFKKIGLQSVSFEQGVTKPDLERLMIVLGDPNAFPTVDDAKQELSRHKVTTIRLNYVVFRKVTTDDEVVSRSGLEDLTEQAAQAAVQGGTPAPGPADNSPSSGPAQQQDDAARHFLALEDDVLGKMSAVFTLKELFEQPNKMAGKLLKASSGMDDTSKAGVVKELRRLGDQVSRGCSADGSPISLDEMMEAVYQLRHDLKDGIAAQKEMGRFFSEQGVVVDEVDQLTYCTIVSMVREEYRNGNFTTRRLAQIIRRMLPDSRDLKRLLPQLKEGLLAEGMTLAEYAKLVNELTTELQSEELVEALKGGAESIGLSVEDIVSGIQQNPGEAARLVVLAAELRQGGVTDDAQLSSVLTEYIERVSGKMALAAPEVGSREGGKALRTVVYRLQKDLVERVKAEGVSPSLAGRIEEQLANRFQHLLDNVKSEWLLNLLSKAGDHSGTYLLESLENVMERQTDLRTLGDPVRRVLAAQGYSGEQIQEFFAAMAERIKQRSQMFLLPKSVLSSNNTTYFLQREIKSAGRYRTPFSCVMMTITAVRGDGEPWRRVEAKEIAEVLPEVFKVLTSHLRDLDFVGSFGSIDNTIPFIILPMTQGSGANAVKRRLADLLDGYRFTLGDRSVELHVVVSACGFDRNRTPDAKSYLQELRTRHSQEEAADSVV